MKRDRQARKGGAAHCAGSRSRTQRRAEAEQQGAPATAQHTRGMMENPPSAEPLAHLRPISGSDDHDFNLNLACQVVAAQWREDSVSDERQVDATLAAMMGMEPRDALEGMLIAQAIASHNAVMECYRRAMISEQTFEGRRENLNQANKLSRTFAALTEALDRHRGKGQQRITVEHVNVHAGGQAIVGAVTSAGASSPNSKEQTRATRETTSEPSTPMRSPQPPGDAMPIARGARKAPV